MWKRHGWLLVAMGVVLLLAAVWGRNAFPARAPDHDGLIEAVAPSWYGGVSLSLRVAPVPEHRVPAENDQVEVQLRKSVGIVIIHVPPAARVRGQPIGGPQVGQRARAWCENFVMESFPPQQVATYVEYQPAGG
jgi:hypothetical protein